MLPFLFTSIITVDPSFVTDMLAYVGTLWTDLELLITVAVGLPVAFWIIRKGITLVRAR